MFGTRFAVRKQVYYTSPVYYNDALELHAVYDAARRNEIITTHQRLVAQEFA